jgi:hypothetical protein
LSGRINVVVNAMDPDDDIAISSVADRCLLSGAIQTSHFKGVRTVFDPKRKPIVQARDGLGSFKASN